MAKFPNSIVVMLTLIAAASGLPQSSLADPTPATSPASTQILGGEMTYHLPTGFQQLTADQVADRFKGKSQPQLVYVDPNNGSQISFSQSTTVLKPADLPLVEPSLLATLRNSPDKYTITSHGLITIQGQQWLQVVATGFPNSVKLNQRMLITIQNGHLLEINFIAIFETAQAKQQQLWQSMKSVKISQLQALPGETSL